MVNNKRWYLRLGILFLLLALVAQVATMLHSQPTTALTGTDVAPRMAGPAGGLASSSVSQADVPEAPVTVAGANGVIIGHSLMNDVSLPLRDIKPIPTTPWTKIREMPEPKGEDQSRTIPAPPVVDTILQSTFGDTLLTMPSTIQNFNGLGNIDGVYPPDTNGDVGPNHYVQWVNSHLQIFNKSGVSVYGPVTGNTIWSGFGGPCQTQNAGDPIVLYDSQVDRWLLAQFTAASPFGECVAVSQTGDPTGAYNRYFFQHSTTVFYDYPHLGVWPDGYYSSFNRFNNSSGAYLGVSAVVYDRAKMLAGQPATYQEKQLGTGNTTLLPSDLDGPTAPPAGAPNYFFNRAASAINEFKFHVDWTTPANTTFTGPTAIPVAAYNQLCASGARSCIPQPGTTVGVDGLGDRLMHRVAYRNFGDHESLVMNHSVSTSGSSTLAGVRWYEVRNPSAPTLYQQGTYAPDSTNRWLGSVAMDHNGDMALGYSVSSSSVYPGIRYTGRLSTDTLGTMPQGEVTMMSGSGSQTGTGNRWGDYAMMTIDPTDDCTFWFTTEYMPSTGTAPWQTRIGSFKFPSCGGTPPPTNTPVPPPTNTPVPPPTNTPNPVATNTPIRTNTPVPPTSTPVPPTATNTPVTGSCAEAVTNGGYEGGTAPWVQTSTNGYQLIDTTRPHTGTHSVYLGGYNNGTDTIYEQLTIPASATSATYTFWWYMTTQESGSTPYDYMYAQVLNSSGGLITTLQTTTNASTKNTWVKSTFNLLPYKGQTVRLYFKGTTDSSLPSSFFVDDVSLNICQ